MRTLLDEPGLQEKGVALLHALATRGTHRTSTLATTEAVSALLSAMGSHPQHLGVQYHGCHALSGFCKSPAVQARRGEVLAAVATAMEGHAEDVKLQAGGVATIMGLATEPGPEGSAQAPSPGRRGLHQAVIAAMKQHPSALAIQRDGAGALSNLAQASVPRPPLSQP